MVEDENGVGDTARKNKIWKSGCFGMLERHCKLERISISVKSIWQRRGKKVYRKKRCKEIL